MSISYLKSYKFCRQTFLVSIKTCMVLSYLYGIHQIEQLFGKGADKHFQHCRPYDLCCNYATQALQHKGSHIQYINDCGYFPNKTLQKQAADSIWSTGHSLLFLVCIILKTENTFLRSCSPIWETFFFFFLAKHMTVF